MELEGKTGVVTGGSSGIGHAVVLDLQFRVDVRAPFLFTRGLLPLSRAARGQIVFVNSSAAYHSTQATDIHVRPFRPPPPPAAEPHHG